LAVDQREKATPGVVCILRPRADKGTRLILHVFHVLRSAMRLFKGEVPLEKVFHLFRVQRKGNNTLKERPDDVFVAKPHLLVQKDAPEISALGMASQNLLEDGTPTLGITQLKLHDSKLCDGINVLEARERAERTLEQLPTLYGFSCGTGKGYACMSKAANGQACSKALYRSPLTVTHFEFQVLEPRVFVRLKFAAHFLSKKKMQTRVSGLCLAQDGTI